MENFELVQELKLELIREYEQYVRTLGGLTGLSEDDAREAIHRAICRVLVGLRKRPFCNPVVAWRPYVIQTAINDLKEQARQIARRKHGTICFTDLDTDGRRELMSAPDRAPGPAEQAERSELATRAWEEMRRLPSYEREVIARRCHGQSFKEIADEMSIKVQTAGGFWTRGVEALRTRFAA